MLYAAQMQLRNFYCDLHMLCLMLTVKSEMNLMPLKCCYLISFGYWDFLKLLIITTTKAVVNSIFIVSGPEFNFYCADFAGLFFDVRYLPSVLAYQESFVCA